MQLDSDYSLSVVLEPEGCKEVRDFFTLGGHFLARAVMKKLAFAFAVSTLASG